MGFWDNVRKKANETWSGADWWDKEENQVQRNNARTGRRDIYVPVAPVAKPAQTFFDKVRDVADANSQMDIYKRTQAKAPKMYAAEQKQLGRQNVYNNPLERTTGSAKAAGDMMVDIVRPYSERLAYDSNDVFNARQGNERLLAQDQAAVDQAKARLADPSISPEQRANWERFLGWKTGEGSNVESALKQREEYEKMSDYKRAAASGAEMAFTVATAPVAIGGGAAIKAAAKGAAKQGAAQAVKAGAKETAKQSATMAGLFAPAGGAAEIAQNPDADVADVAKATATAGAIGAGLGVALPVAGAIAKPVAKTAGKAISKAVRGTAQVTKNVVDDVAEVAKPGRVREIDGLIKQYQKAYDVESNPTRKAQISRGITELNAARRAVNEGGFAKVGKADPVGETIAKSRELIKQTDEVAASGKTPQAPIEGELLPNGRFGPVNIENGVRTQFGTAFVDKDAALIKVLKRMEKQSGRTGLVDRFYYDSGLQSRANSIANNKMATSAELKAAMQGLGNRQLNEFNEYAAARAELTMAKRGMKTSKPMDDLQRIVDDLGEEYGERFTALNKYYKERAKDLYDAGIIDKAKYNQFIESDDYIRIQRDFDDLVGRSSGTGNSYSFGRSLTSFKRKGSERELLPTDQTTFEYTQQIQKEIQRNQTASNLIDTLSEFGMTRRLTTKEAVNKNTIKRIVNGKTEVYEVDPILKDVIDNIRPYSLNGLERIIGAPARVFRAGTTALSAPFSAANYLRDQAGSAINSRNVRATHLSHPQNIFTGLWEAGKDFGVGNNNDELWQKFIAHAGDTTQYDLTRNVRDTRMLSRELRHGQAGRAANAVMHPIRTLEDLNAITEKATRFQNFKGTYEDVLARTNDPDMAMQQATIAAWQNSIDFNRAGNIGRFLNLMIPYFNAGIQGTRQMGKSFTRSPSSAVATTAKAIGIVGMPLYAATAWNMSDPERKEIYDNLRDYEKENNLIFILPWTEQNEQGSYNVLKFPLPPGYKDVIMPGRRAMESFANKEPADFAAMANDLMQAVAGPIQVATPTQALTSLIPQAVKPLVHQVANKDFFTDTPVVPDHIENATDADGNPIPEEKKARDWTSGSAKIIGERLGISPIRVEKFLKDTFGSVGQYAVNTTDNALAAAGAIDEEEIGGRSAITDIARRFTQASGEVNHKASDGTKYYIDVEEVLQGRTGNTKNRWEAIHPSKSNFLGDEINEKSIVDSGVKAGVYLQDPEVFEIDRELDARARKRGKPGNPLFDLDVNQRQTILSLQANKNFNPGDKAMVDVIEKQNPWIRDYYNAQSEYYDAIAAEGGGKKGSDKAPNGIRRPEPSEDVERMFDVAGQITDPKQKAQFYKDNPELTEYLAQNEDYNRAKRAYLGLPQLDRFPENPQMKALEEKYFSLSDKSARKAFMAANPGLSDYWLEKNLWQLNEAGARARFEGEELDEGTVKDIMSIARSLGYGSGGGGGWGGGSGGSGGGGGGRSYGISNTANAPEMKKVQLRGTVKIKRNKSTPGKIAVKRGGRV